MKIIILGHSIDIYRIDKIFIELIFMSKLSPSNILLVLQTIIPNDLAKMIIQVYVCVRIEAWKNVKPGQIIFESPCGHILRFTIDRKPCIFIWPGDSQVNHLNKNIYSKITTKYSYVAHLDEIGTSSIFAYVSCHECKRHWTYTNKVTDLQEKIMCFCGKATINFPCNSCSINECAIKDCNNLVDQKSIAVLCRDHVRCYKCKCRLDYDYSIPDDCEFPAGWIKCSCKCKRANDSFPFREDTFRKIFNDYGKYLNSNYP
jgi:hypothetical protein